MSGDLGSQDSIWYEHFCELSIDAVIEDDLLDEFPTVCSR